jgi:phospholipid/cholesterol/gamma-HCH transport system substrate-binding protein
MLDSSNDAVKKLQSTLEASTTTMKDLDALIAKVNTGNGSLSLLMNDKKLYSNLESTTKNLSLLLQDLRLNPKRYVNVSIFGKKDKAYTLPAGDPAVVDTVR